MPPDSGPPRALGARAAKWGWSSVPRWLAAREKTCTRALSLLSVVSAFSAESLKPANAADPASWEAPDESQMGRPDGRHRRLGRFPRVGVGGPGSRRPGVPAGPPRV